MASRLVGTYFRAGYAHSAASTSAHAIDKFVHANDMGLHF
jgi:hypothetical protein